MRRILKGDANFSGGVDFNDLLLLAQNYNLAGRVWTTADFDYDGLSDFADLLILAQTYGQTQLLDGSLQQVSLDFEADWALARSMVPEPAAMASLVAVGVAGLRRRR
jgi:hypothetical protein